MNKQEKLFQAIGEANDADLMASESGIPAHKRSIRTPFRRTLLIAALISTMLLLMGAGLYTRWADTLQREYKPTQDIKEQAEKSGLSADAKKLQSAPDSIVSATDQGITVSVVQTVADRFGANVVLRIEGFPFQDGAGICPHFTEIPPTLGGDEHFWSSSSYEFFNGILSDVQGNSIYADGTLVELYEDGSEKEHYVQPDGSLELVLRYDFSDREADNLEQELVLHFTGFGYDTQLAKAVSEFTTTVNGNWELRFPIHGFQNPIHWTPNLPVGEDGDTLLEVEITPLTVRTVYHTKEYFAGWETLDLYPNSPAGVKMTDGSFVQCYPMTEGYKDEENLIYFSDNRTFRGMIDLEKAEALAFCDGWETGENGKQIPIYRFLPIETQAHSG